MSTIHFSEDNLTSYQKIWSVILWSVKKMVSWPPEIHTPGIIKRISIGRQNEYLLRCSIYKVNASSSLKPREHEAEVKSRDNRKMKKRISVVDIDNYNMA